MKTKLVLGLLLILAVQNQVDLQEIYSTNYTCANTLAELSCPKDYVIFVTRIEYKYTSGQCIDYDDAQGYMSSALTTGDTLDDCVGIDSHNEYFTSRCNGQQNCFVEIKKKSHLTGYAGTNCDFESNMANVYYACVPGFMREPFKKFDLCDANGPDTILGVENGFIYSPNFPDYYGNSHECYVNLGIPENKRLVIYLLKMNLEGNGLLKVPKDYVQIEALPKLYGKAVLPHIVYNGSDRERVHIRFRTDWITLAKLDYPKGFLLYFSLYTINQPTTSTATTTTTTTTTTTRSTTAEITTQEVTRPLLDAQVKLNESLSDAFHKREQLINTQREDERDKSAFVITTLVALVGLLIVIIFGLLFMNRKKPSSNEEDTIYVYEKPINNTNNNNNNNLEMSQNETLNMKPTFSSRLRHVYQNIAQRLQNSNDNNTSSVTLKLDESKLTEETSPCKSFNVNEFKPDAKCDKDIPIVSLRMKENNLRLEQERCNENPYVSNPLSILEVNIADEANKRTCEDEVYTSIPELETDQEEEEEDASLSSRVIYSTPTNVTILLKSKNNESRPDETDA